MDGKSCVSVAIGFIAAYYTTTKQCCHYFRESFLFVRTYAYEYSTTTKRRCHYFRESFLHLRCRLFVCLARLAHIGRAPACAPFGSPSARFPPKGFRLSAVHLCTPHRPNCMLTSLQCRLLGAPFCIVQPSFAWRTMLLAFLVAKHQLVSPRVHRP